MLNVGVTAVGMVSSLGPTAAAACAAARAGISGARELETFVPGEDGELEAGVVMGHGAAGSGFVGRGKAQSLLAGALGDLGSRFEAATCIPERTSVHVALSNSFFVRRWAAESEGDEERDLGIGEDDATALCAWTCATLGLAVPPANRSWSLNGRMGVVSAVARAAHAIQAGHLDHVVVVAAESMLEPRHLEACSNLGVLKGPDNPCGFEPGEAGVALLVERTDQNTGPHVGIDSWAGREGSSDRFGGEPPAHDAVAVVIAEALAHTGSDESIPLVVGDINGEVFRSQAWGQAVVDRRCSALLRDADLWVPAASFGETGAATAAVAICMLTRGYKRGYAPPGRSVVWLLEDDGSAGSIVLRGAGGRHGQ